MVCDYMRLAGDGSAGAEYMRFGVDGSPWRCCVWSRNAGNTVLGAGRRMDRTRKRLDAFDVGGEL
jgi:hypothetical protein